MKEEEVYGAGGLGRKCGRGTGGEERGGGVVEEKAAEREEKKKKKNTNYIPSVTNLHTGPYKAMPPNLHV